MEASARRAQSLGRPGKGRSASTASPSPALLFSGLLVFIFLVIIRPQDLAPSLQEVPLVFMVMGVLLFGWLFSRTPKKLFQCPQDKFLTLFLLAIVVSTLLLRWISFSVETAIDTLKTGAIYFFIVTILGTSMERFKKITWTIVFFMSVVGLIGILQAYGHDITGIGMYWAADKGVWQIRGMGIFNNPNDLAYSVVIVVPFALGLFVKSKSLTGKLAALLLIFVSLYTIYLTQSRGGQLALVFCMTIWLTFWLKNKALNRLTVVFGIIVVVFAFASSTEGYRSDASSMGRVEAWAAGMDMLRESPIVGVGKDQFIEHHERDSHSSYVRAGAELGLLGLYAYIGILYFAFQTMFRATKVEENTEMKLYSVGYISYLSAYAVGSIFSTRTYDIIFLIIVALTSVCRQILMNSPQVKDPGYFGNAGIWNRNIFALSFVTVIVWKLFLVQVW